MAFFGGVLLLGGTAGLLAYAVLFVTERRNPLRETNRQERSDSRALRRENAMPMWGKLANMELAWSRYRGRRAYVGKRRRPEEEPPSELLAKLIAIRQSQPSHA